MVHKVRRYFFTVCILSLVFLACLFWNSLSASHVTQAALKQGGPATRSKNINEPLRHGGWSANASVHNAAFRKLIEEIESQAVKKAPPGESKLGSDYERDSLDSEHNNDAAGSEHTNNADDDLEHKNDAVNLKTSRQKSPEMSLPLLDTSLIKQSRTHISEKVATNTQTANKTSNNADSPENKNLGGDKTVQNAKESSKDKLDSDSSFDTRANKMPDPASKDSLQTDNAVVDATERKGDEKSNPASDGEGGAKAEREQQYGTRPESCQQCFRLNFPTLINRKKYCSDLSLNTVVLLLITSAPLNQDKRTAIRETWGAQCQLKHSTHRCLFVVGDAGAPEQNEMLAKENELYHDILQLGFKDAYANLTYKTLTSLQWVVEHCDKVSYVMKTDDDMYVNTDLIPTLLTAAPVKDFIGGHCWGPSLPHRNVFSKWYVPVSSYAQSQFPPMCSGTGYIMSKDVVGKILSASQNVPFFHLEDVYVALCLRKIGIQPVKIAGFSNMYESFQPCSYRNQVMTSHQVPSTLLSTYWAEAHNLCPGDLPSAEQLFQTLPLPSLV